MSVRPEEIPPLPKVASPPAGAWHYFRTRHLPMLTSGLVVVMAVWLWAMNLPESPGGAGAASTVARPANSVPSAERQAGELLHTNKPDLHTSLTNGNLSIGGGFVEND